MDLFAYISIAKVSLTAYRGSSLEFEVKQLSRGVTVVNGVSKWLKERSNGPCTNYKRFLGFTIYTSRRNRE